MKLSLRNITFVVVLSLVFTTVISPITNAKPRPVRSAAAGERVLKELKMKCSPNGKIVTDEIKERCDIIVKYLAIYDPAHPDDPDKSSLTRCQTIIPGWGAKPGNKWSATFDQTKFDDCVDKVADLKKKQMGGGIGDYNCGKAATFFNFGAACESAKSEAADKTSPIIQLGLTIINWMTGLVALLVVGGIITGGFIYMTARDNSGQTQKGITVIVNAVLALIIWVMAYAIINFLVPGGLFRP